MIPLLNQNKIYFSTISSFALSFLSFSGSTRIVLSFDSNCHDGKNGGIEGKLGNWVRLSKRLFIL